MKAESFVGEVLQREYRPKHLRRGGRVRSSNPAATAARRAARELFKEKVGSLAVYMRHSEGVCRAYAVGCGFFVVVEGRTPQAAYEGLRDFAITFKPQALPALGGEVDS